jgi:hypothetical protein
MVSVRLRVRLRLRVRVRDRAAVPLLTVHMHGVRVRVRGSHRAHARRDQSAALAEADTADCILGHLTRRGKPWRSEVEG